MKKVIAGMALCACFGTEGMLVPYGSDTSIVPTRREERVPEDLSRTGVMAMTEEELTGHVNFRMVSPTPLPSQNEVSVLISDYFRTDDIMVQIGSPSARRYPLQRELQSYLHNLSRGYSYSVQKLFVHIDDIEFADRTGDIVLDEEYVDEKNSIRHQTRPVAQYEMNDELLQAKQLSEIFIATEAGEQVIDAARIRDDSEAIAYARLDSKSEETQEVKSGKLYRKTVLTEKYERPDCSVFEKKTEKLEEIKDALVPTNAVGFREESEGFCYAREEKFEEWTTPDGTIFCKRTEGVKKVAKPKLPDPIEPKPEQILMYDFSDWDDECDHWLLGDQ